MSFTAHLTLKICCLNFDSRTVCFDVGNVSSSNQAHLAAATVEHQFLSLSLFLLVQLHFIFLLPCFRYPGHPLFKAKQKKEAKE